MDSQSISSGGTSNSFMYSDDRTLLELSTSDPASITEEDLRTLRKQETAIKELAEKTDPSKNSLRHYFNGRTVGKASLVGVVGLAATILLPGLGLGVGTLAAMVGAGLFLAEGRAVVREYEMQSKQEFKQLTDRRIQALEILNTSGRTTEEEKKLLDEARRARKKNQLLADQVKNSAGGYFATAKDHQDQGESFDTGKLEDHTLGLEGIHVPAENIHEVAAEKELMGQVKRGVHRFKARLKEHEDKPYQAGELPSVATYQGEVKKQVEEFIAEITGYKEAFEKTNGTSDEFKEKTAKFDQWIDALQEDLSKRQKAVDEFKVLCEGIDSSLIALEDAIKEAAPEAGYRSVLNAILATAESPNVQVRGYGVAKFATALVESFRKQEGIDKSSTESLESARMMFERRQKVLHKLLPENLPLNLQNTLSKETKSFLGNLVKKTKERLIEETKPDALPDELNDTAGRSQSGMQLAWAMLDDSEICSDVYSLLTSLQENHAGINKKEFDYAAASLSGLRRIRQNHHPKLVYMPTMGELLAVAKYDLKQVDSKLTTEAVRLHHGDIKNSRNQYRRDKLISLCQKLEVLEAEVGDQLRGHLKANDQMTPPHHQYVLDCFASAGQKKEVIYDEKSLKSVPGVDGVKRGDLLDNEDGLFNAFFSQCNAKVRVEVEEKTQTQRIYTDSQPQLVFINKGGRWQVNMGGESWFVDPTFITDNPEFHVPFQTTGSEKIERDWLPVCDSNGNTAILVLRKIAPKDRYYLYEKSGEGLVNKPISENHEEIDAEKIEAGILYWAAIQDNGPKVAKVGVELSKVNQEVTALYTARREWIDGFSLDDLKQFHSDLDKKLTGESNTIPLIVVPASDDLKNHTLVTNELREIAENKKNQDKINGARLQTYDRNHQKFSHFSVGACFNKVSDKYYAAVKARMGENSVLNKQTEASQMYQQDVFQELEVFSGCELSPQVLPGAVVNVKGHTSPENGTPAQVRYGFSKAVKIKRDHCMRLEQQIGFLRAHLLDIVRTEQKDLDKYSDQQVLNQLVREFENGNLPESLKSQEEIDKLANWILAENDLKQNSILLRRLKILNRKLTAIDNDASTLVGKNEFDYQKRCQEWNLEMALAASDVKALDDRLNRKLAGESKLTAENRAIMSFERRAGTVLRSGAGSDQVTEVHQVLDEISKAMIHNSPMQRVSQLGTGWGKSTMIQLWSDHACRLNKGRQDRSVLVIAPERNKKDLDILLTRYFSSNNTQYQSLNIMSQYVKEAAGKGHVWWEGNRLVEIHNTLLGIPKDTLPNQRQVAVEKNRAPVGASIQDVQILMHLRKGLQAKDNKSSEESEALTELDAISDLLSQSMIFADEWDSAMVPHSSNELKEMKDNINKALGELKDEGYVEASSESIIHDHSAFILGCQRKHLLSATTGTSYAAAVVSGAENVDQLAGACHTDPFTTTPRLWHLLEMSEPVFVDADNAKERKQQACDQIIQQVGTDKPLLILNSTDAGVDSFTEAENNRGILAGARQKQVITGQSAPVKSRGTLYYDDKKQLCQILPGDRRYDPGNKYAALTNVDEAVIRSQGGANVDVTLTHNELVGTDAPQCQDSVGVVFGVFELKENERLPLMTQLLGRVTRGTRSMRKPQKLFLAVNKAAIDALEDSLEKEAYKEQYEQWTTKKQAFKNSFSDDILPSNVAKVMNEPINISLHTKDPTKSLDDSMHGALQEKLDELARTQWVSLNLTPDQQEKLKELKQQQWNMKVAYLELLSVQLEAHDVTDHTKMCEQKIQEAAVASAMNQAVAEEELWLKRSLKDDGGLKKIKFSSQGVKGLPTAEARGQFHKALTDKIAEELVKIPRRIVDSEDSENMVDNFDPGTMKEKIFESFDRVKQKGLDAVDIVDMNALEQRCVDKSMGVMKGLMSEIKKMGAELKRLSCSFSIKEHNKYHFKVGEEKLNTYIKTLEKAKNVTTAQKTEDRCSEVVADIERAVNALILPTRTKPSTKETSVIENIKKTLNGLVDDPVELNKQGKNKSFKEVKKESPLGKSGNQKYKYAVLNKDMDDSFRVDPYKLSSKLMLSQKAEFSLPTGDKITLFDLQKAFADHKSKADEQANQVGLAGICKGSGFESACDEVKSYFLDLYDVEAKRISVGLERSSRRIAAQNKLIMV